MCGVVCVMGGLCVCGVDGLVCVGGRALCVCGGGWS